MGFFFFLIAVGALVYFIKTVKATQEQWKFAAQRLHLSYQSGDLNGYGTIKGSLDGHRVTVNTYNKSGPGGPKPCTQYRVAYRDPLPIDLKLMRQGLAKGVEKVYGMQDIILGDPAFDDYFLVYGAKPDKVRNLLSAGLQSAIKEVALCGNDVTVTSSYVEIDRTGRDRDSAIIVQTVRRLAGFSETMMDAAGDAMKQRDAAASDARPSAMPIIEIEPPEPAPSTGLPDTMVTVEAESWDAVMDEVAALDDEIPDDREAKPEATTPAESMEPEEPAVPAGPVDLEETARMLYEGEGRTLAASKMFEEHCRNRHVTGSGELLRIGKFSYDPVFTDTKGVKATFTVCVLKDAYSKFKVIAEVVYPTDRHDWLETRIGTTMPIEGALIGQDAMMHRLYVVAD